MSVQPAFFTLAALYQRMSQTARAYNMKRTTVGAGHYSSDDTSETTYRLKEPIVVTNTNLVDQCTRSEWYLVGLIMRDMYQYNALWMADAKLKRDNKAYRLGLLGLLKKEVLFPTETKHIYIVNPVHLRRGDPFAVTATTANMLSNRKPTAEMLEDRRPVSQFQFSLPESPRM